MPYQNLTTYTEVDPGSDLSKTATRATATNLPANLSAYIYKDFGASYFNSLDIDFTISLTSITGDWLAWPCFGLTQTAVGSLEDWADNDPVLVFYSDGEPQIYFLDGPAGSYDHTDVNLSSIYYCTCVREAGSGTITINMYNESARTSLYYSHSLTTFGTGTRYRYLYALSSGNQADASTASYYTENIDLNPPIPPPVWFYDSA